ncbi:hypothetical protein [Streptomyces beihaiensis]|uniref:Htaa domain-containing protein n=1 Tax=Streptomyces beihaiensis TaxID=2984495 RepID=A0ABT3TZU6_9ACTN|nr:hypothetical protein [Streptomyces beihaiensis]MCX3061872.1 hypothetical protein [Streptomyces beihaiensis]
MQITSGWLPTTGQTRTDTRLTSLGALTPTSPVATRSGVLPGSANGQWIISGFTVTGSSAMTATVYPGRAVIQGTDSQGAYPVALTSNVDLTFADGDAQYGRIDLIVARVYDDSYDASGKTEATVEIVQGTPAATPAVPATPALSLPLYQVSVPAGTSAGGGGIAWSTALTGVRTATVAVGGILPVISDSRAGAYPGQYRDNNGQLERWDGSAWAAYPPVPTWQSWTPDWTTSTGNSTPSYGNASLNCRYTKIGTTVHMTFDVIFGSTTNFGGGGTSDNWVFSLPVGAASTIETLGWAVLQDDTQMRSIARIRGYDSSRFWLEISSGMPNGNAVATTGLTDAVSPWTWASGMHISGSATYEAGTPIVVRPL